MHEKLKFEQIKKDSCASLRYDYSSLYPKDEMPLHFHPEIEICYVVKGSGYRMIGDFLEPFEEGEVVLVPTNQPHCWMYNPESCEPDGKRRCIVVQDVYKRQAKGIRLPDGQVFSAIDAQKIMPNNSTTSMHSDFQKGNRTEVETLTGYVVRTAQELGIEVPTYQFMYKGLTEFPYPVAD